MSATVKRHFYGGKQLAPEVSLDRDVLARLIVAHYMTVGGGKCENCPTTESLRLVRRDGEPRDRSVYGLAAIVNAGLPATYTMRCPKCISRLAAERGQKRRAQQHRLLKKHGAAE